MAIATFSLAGSRFSGSGTPFKSSLMPGTLSCLRKRSSTALRSYRSGFLSALATTAWTWAWRWRGRPLWRRLALMLATVGLLSGCMLRPPSSAQETQVDSQIRGEALGAGITNSLISLTVVFIPPIARVAESVTTQIRGRDFVEAARASGANAFTIVRVHVLGNVLGPVFVYATSLIAVSMILASGLSFLGLGVKPPEPEWGLMLNTLRTAIYTQPWIAALPGMMIFCTSIAFNLLSDGLRSAMEVKQ